MFFERLAGLPLAISDYRFERLSGGERVTTHLRLCGGGFDGVGEDIMPNPEALAALTGLALAGAWTLEGFLDHLATVDQWGDEQPEWELAPNCRNWTFESAALDLALRQAGLSLPEALGLTPRPLTFVNSMGLGDPPSADTVLRRVAMYPSVGFKLDAEVTWTPSIVAELAGTGLVRTVDFKGRYGFAVEDVAALGALYDVVLSALPDALIEDPHDIPEILDRLPPERVSFDATIVRASDIGSTRTVNVKPSRIGGLRPLLEIYEHCAAAGVAMYGGGMGELGVGRQQIQLLASLFHADAWNDVAPSAFNLPEPIPGLPSSPLDPGSPPHGFRLTSGPPSGVLEPHETAPGGNHRADDARP